MLEFIKTLGFRRKTDFTTRVLECYRSVKPVSAFARTLFIEENAGSINARFAKARHKVPR
ncbi:MULTISPECIES: hypothetical protein [unclassified Erwinia]|uniref:hypothetical protein n=1 Tax=unclassified Erwinia TaxID=2622719 RepID=UPI0006FE2EB7|nr:MULTISPECIES: hypothetical protein [unclassified Erwinia]KQN61784.1 hypothetical protein ASF13_21690 [Erwinia sp. Leaf53]PLV54274.1 hypothetical protein NV64_18275 [Erwinia sp. B116]